MAAPAYLLDTGILLLSTRAGNASKVIDAQFGLSASSFRPAICEVSVGELLAFATANHWGEKRKAELMERLKASLILPISHPGVHQRWADMQSTLQGAGIAVGQNDLWIAATASVTGLTVRCRRTRTSSTWWRGASCKPWSSIRRPAWWCHRVTA
ncbi:MAG: PIN domain-containing protein [Burkholderiales bacterium]|nr:PIN domain-containing protein [Burkholderiales bacterium]